MRRLTVANAHKRRGGGLRGVITGFSRAARKRLVDLTLRLDTTGVRCTFLTLTFSGSPDNQTAKAALKRFTMRLRRLYPDMSALWRLERQERGAIHFHLILFNLPYIPQKGLQSVWEQCTGEARSIIHIKLLNSNRAVFNYVSKYVAKPEEVLGSPSLDELTYQHASGRHWGYINKKALPFAVKWSFHVADDDAIRYAMWSCFALSHGKAGRSTEYTRLYCQDALEMLRYTLSICTHVGWQVIEERRLRLFRRAIAKMPYVISYTFTFQHGFPIGRVT